MQEILPFYPLGLMEEVQPRDKLKEEARLISPDCSNSCLDQGKMLEMQMGELIVFTLTLTQMQILRNQNMECSMPSNRNMYT